MERVPGRSPVDCGLGLLWAPKISKIIFPRSAIIHVVLWTDFVVDIRRGAEVVTEAWDYVPAWRRQQKVTQYRMEVARQYEVVPSFVEFR